MKKLDTVGWEALFFIVMQRVESDLTTLIENEPMTHDAVRAHLYSKLSDLQKETARLKAAIE
jgi:hypothetical protein